MHVIKKPVNDHRLVLTSETTKRIFFALMKVGGFLIQKKLEAACRLVFFHWVRWGCYINLIMLKV
jgi:hypothetical protein